MQSLLPLRNGIQINYIASIQKEILQFFQMLFIAEIFITFGMESEKYGIATNQLYYLYITMQWHEMILFSVNYLMARKAIRY